MKPVHLLAATLMLAGCTNHHTTDTTAERLDSLFTKRYASDMPAPGAAVLIAQGDSIIYERYFGYADLETLEPVTDSTLFNIASISKQFTVVALLQLGGDTLVSPGNLTSEGFPGDTLVSPPIDINAPCSDFFDYPQPFWHDVTLAHLGSHTSGIPDSRDRSDRDRCVYATDSSSMAYFPTVDTLKFAPGTAYDYLNPSFLLLANVVEQKTGMPFVEYMHKHVFAPAGMSQTVYFDPAGMPEHTSHAYLPDDKREWHEYDYGEETFFATRPDGGIYSTARDLLRWEKALAEGKLINDSLLQMAYTPHVDVSSSPWCDYQRRPNTSYGLGWFIDTTPGRPVKVYHTGDNGGYQAYLAKYPEMGLRIIVLENRNDRDRWPMAQKIDEILLEQN